MIAVDVLEAPKSYWYNQYLLVIQDYYAKSADGIPLPNHTTAAITTKLGKVCHMFGLPNILHPDQGWNYKSAILKQTLDAFSIKESCTTAYHSQGDGMV